MLVYKAGNISKICLRYERGIGQLARFLSSDVTALDALNEAPKLSALTG